MRIPLHLRFYKSICKKLILFIVLCLATIPNVLADHRLATIDQQLPTPIRAIHFTSRNVPIDRMKQLIDSAADNRFNVVVIGFAWRDSTWLESMPWVAKTAEWNPDRIREITKYITSKSMVLVPNVPLLTHQQLLLADHFPELLYNEKTYDPNKEKLNELVLPIVNELLKLTEAPAFHIGHDEVYGSPNRPNAWKMGDQLLPASLFLKSVVTLNDFINKNGAETWMWGDMLVGENEFPKMKNISLLGDVPGYGSTLRNKIPKNILIVDWHYFHRRKSFPTIDAFQKSGLRVLGSTWSDHKNISRFSKYASNKNSAGMLATTWATVWSHENSELTKEIIKPSGELFFEWFPDK